MSQSLSQTLIHVIFSTRGRHPWLKDDLMRLDLYRYMGGILERLECHPLEIGGVKDHVHVLCNLHRTKSVSELVRELKRGSSAWAKSRLEDDTFSWQNGYGVFSIGMSQVKDSKRYISEQAKHHEKRNFQEEFLSFLEKYKVEYQEAYIWD